MPPDTVLRMACQGRACSVPVASGLLALHPRNGARRADQRPTNFAGLRRQSVSRAAPRSRRGTPPARAGPGQSARRLLASLPICLPAQRERELTLSPTLDSSRHMTLWRWVFTHSSICAGGRSSVKPVSGSRRSRDPADGVGLQQCLSPLPLALRCRGSRSSWP